MSYIPLTPLLGTHGPSAASQNLDTTLKQKEKKFPMWWYTFVIPKTQESKASGSCVQGLLGLCSKTWSQNKERGGETLKW
jgi:hypothetical protein